MSSFKFSLGVVVLCFTLVVCKKSGEDKPKWAKKDIRDYSDADLERLLDQWDEDEEPLPEDELPEHLRPRPKINFDPSNIGNPEDLLKMSKKGQTLMVFVQVVESKSPEEAEEITKLWQSALWNNHIQAEKYMVDKKRAIFMFKDGAQAWEAKDFLIEQEDLLSVSIESKIYHGKHTPEGKKEQEAGTAENIWGKKEQKEAGTAENKSKNKKKSKKKKDEL